MATPADVREIFEARLKETSNPTELFHPADLERAKDEKYLKRVLLHQEKDPKAAADMLWDILTWRKSVGANEINESNIRMDYVNEGMFFPHGRDVDGCLLIILKSKMHIKGQKDYDQLKKIMIYWFDRVEREENGNRITLFLDMDGSGLGNMDMELVKYLITMFKLHYPYFLNYIIIYNMPWVLTAAFKVVKTLLPAKAIEKMKFTNNNTLKEYVSPEQALKCWGGKNDYTFVFVPEKIDSPKKVTFAEQEKGDQHSPGEMLRLSPNDTINFKFENEETSGQFTITNMDEGSISFKIRTTAPEKFRVRPSAGTLPPGGTQTILITVQPGFHLQTVTKDRFLVLSVQIPKVDLTPKDLSEIWKSSTDSKVDEYRLKCQFPEKEIAKNGNIIETEKPDSNNSFNNLQNNFEMLKKQLEKLKMLQFVTLFLTAVTVLFGYFIFVKSDNGYCDRM